MASGAGLQERAAALSSLSNVYRTLFVNPESSIVTGYVQLLQQTQLVAYHNKVPSRALRGTACQGVYILPGSQRLKVTIETDNSDDDEHPEEHLAMTVQYESDDDKRWVLVRTQDASGFDFGNEPEYEDHSQFLRSHKGPALLREILVKAGMPARCNPLGLLAILFVPLSDEEVLQALDEWPEFDEEPDTGDTLKMGWPEQVAHILLEPSEPDSE